MKTPLHSVFLIAASTLLVSAAASAAVQVRPIASRLAAEAPASPADDTNDETNPWSALKRYTYDQRELFAAGTRDLQSRVDAQVTELAAKRAEMNANNTSTQEWDFATEEMKRARTALISTSDDMTKATRENWDQQKEQVGLAWVLTQDAYAKVKASTTN